MRGSFSSRSPNLSRTPQMRGRNVHLRHAARPMIIAATMASTFDQMIAALNAFNSDPESEMEDDLYEITEGFESLPDKGRVIPAGISGCSDAKAPMAGLNMSDWNITASW